MTFHGSGTKAHCRSARKGGAELRRSPLKRARAAGPQDSGKGALPDFLVERHDQRVSAAGLLQPHVTAALADNRPAVSLKRPHQRLA